MKNICGVAKKVVSNILPKDNFLEQFYIYIYIYRQILYILIALNLAYNKNKLYKTLGY